MLYSKSTSGFYDREIHGASIPADAVQITAQEHAALMAGQSAGKVIRPDDAGRPVLTDRPAPTADQLATAVRAKRNTLIAATDYMVMPDYPADADRLTAIKAYRQTLRDITRQSGFPAEIDWPILGTQ